MLHYSPEIEKNWKRYARNIGLSWRVDETYVKVRGQWTYLYRAVAGEGRTVDFWLSQRPRCEMQPNAFCAEPCGSTGIRCRSPWMPMPPRIGH